jgi:Icc-related predicted phosphoesterase
MEHDGKRQQVRLAAAGDIHCAPHNRDEIVAAFGRLEGRVDLVLLAGDLTTHGDPEEAEVLVDACRPLSVPVYAVLGNHDHHCRRVDEVADVVRQAGIVLLDRSWDRTEIGGTSIGVVGTKGFVGGFPGAELPDFGEGLLRDVYAETTEEVKALDRGLVAVADCPLRIVLLHYSPSLGTLEGEPEGILAFLGCHRLAGPIAEYKPDLVLHGHAHEGSFEARIGATPVYNVAVPVMRRDFWILELEGISPTPTEHPSVRVGPGSGP